MSYHTSSPEAATSSRCAPARPQEGLNSPDADALVELLSTPPHCRL